MNKLNPLYRNKLLPFKIAINLIKESFANDNYADLACAICRHNGNKSLHTYLIKRILLNDYFQNKMMIIDSLALNKCLSSKNLELIHKYGDIFSSRHITQMLDGRSYNFQKSNI